VKSVDVSKQKAVKSSVVVSTKTEKKQAKPVAKSVQKTTSKQSASLSVSNKGNNTIATSKIEKKDSIKPVTKKIETKDTVAPKTEKSSKKSSTKNATKEIKETTPSNDLTPPPSDEALIELDMPSMPPLQLTLQEKKPAGRSKSSNKASEKPSAAGLEAMKMPEGKGAAAFAMHPKEEKPIIKPSTKKVRYSDADLKMFRQHIQKIKDEALDEMRMLKERLDDLTNAEMASESMIYSVHMAEQGSEALEKEKTYAQMNRIFDYIKKLDDAIKRIDDKTYGICKECNILIAKARLLAVPITTQSASYKIHGRCPDNGIDIIAGRNE
jgi:RNA polymerase-binding transcription factor DksA